MMCRRGKAGDGVPKLLFPLVPILLGVFVAALLPVGTFGLTAWFERSKPKYAPMVALQLGEQFAEGPPKKPVLLIMRVAEWRLKHGLLKNDLFRLEDTTASLILHMTCHAYNIGFRGKSRFEETKKRVGACRERANGYLKKRGFAEVASRVFEVMEAHAGRLLKYASAEQSNSGSDELAIVDTIDDATTGITTFFFYCQQTTLWDDKSSECLGASVMGYSPEHARRYSRVEKSTQANATQVTGGESNKAYQPEDEQATPEQRGRHTLVLLRPLKPIEDENGEQRQILVFDLMRDERETWGRLFEIRKAVGGGIIWTFSCNTDIAIGWKSQSRKDETGALQFFSGVNLDHLDSCLSQAPSSIVDKSTDRFIASSQMDTLQAYARSQETASSHTPKYKLILKKPSTDPRLNVKLDPALWESYSKVGKFAWELLASGAEGKYPFRYCRGNPLFIVHAVDWQLTYYIEEKEEKWPQEEGYIGIDLRGENPIIYQFEFPNNSIQISRETKFVLNKIDEATQSQPPARSLLICPSLLNSSALGQYVRRVVISPDDTDYDIRFTQLFMSPV